MEKQGSESAARNFWVLDKDGLITEERSNLPDYVSRFARPVGVDARDGAGLLEVVKAVKPTVLLGLAGAAHTILFGLCRLVSASSCWCDHVCSPLHVARGLVGNCDHFPSNHPLVPSHQAPITCRWVLPQRSALRGCMWMGLGLCSCKWVLTCACA